MTEQKTQIISINGDADDLFKLLDRIEAEADADPSFKKFMQTVFRRFHYSGRISELISVHSKSDPTRAGEVMVSFKPTDRFRNLAAAAFAGDFDINIFDDRFHDSFPCAALKDQQ